MPATETLIRVYASSGRVAQCRGCNADIVWMDTLLGRHMPMNASAVPRRSEPHPSTGRVIVFYAAADSHWATCPAREQFRRGR